MQFMLLKKKKRNNESKIFISNMIVLKAFYFFFTEEKESLETRKGSPLPPISKSPPPAKAILPNVPITLIMGELISFS